MRPAYVELTRQEHARRYTALKNAGLKVQAVRGVNTGLGVCAQWGPTPRSGARWSDEENEALLVLLLEKSENRPKIGPTEIAELGWEIGRTANAVSEQLKKLLGRAYYERIEI